jgi:hypothetical protein
MTVFGVRRPHPLAMTEGLIGMSRTLRPPLEYWRSLRAAIFDPYRPELHYMRGPGPKWRAKHASTSVA